MRKLKRSLAVAMITAMSIGMLPTKVGTIQADAAQTKKVTVKKTEVTVSSGKELIGVLKKNNVNKIILKANAIKNLRVPRGNYKDKTLIISSAVKSKIFIAKEAVLKKIVYRGAVKNASLAIDGAGNKIELASDTVLSVSGKAPSAELIYKAGSETAKVTSKIELVVSNKTKKDIKAVIAGKKVTVKAGKTYPNKNLNIEDDETAQGEANINVNDDKTPEGSAVTGDTGNNTTGTNTGGGYFGGGYIGGGTTADTGNKVGQIKLVNEARTKLVDATSFLRYVVVNFEKNYTKANTKVYVDGIDITGELTPVDKEGTIVKWEVSSLNPAEVKIVSKADDKISQTVKLKRDKNAGKVVAPVLTKETKSAKYIIGYGRVASWDYYLSNYDAEGKIRVQPKSTTFDLDLKNIKNLTERPYFTEPALEGGDVKIKFNYTDDADKKWFDAIATEGALQLVQDDENQKDLNKNLKYSKEFETHDGKMIAVLVVSSNQSNFQKRGYYRVRIKSAASNVVMVRIKLESKDIPVFLLKEPAVQPGKDLHFAVKNIIVGVERPIEKVELILPTGELKTLRYMSDYYLFNDLFVLYNDVNRGKESDGTKGVNNIPYNGNYTLRVHFNGYKTIDKVFNVTGGEDVENKEDKAAVINRVMTMGNKSGLLSLDGMKIDAIAGASKVTTSPGGGSGTGSHAVSANIIFNIDLVANAEIFKHLKIENAYAKGIVDRYEKDMTEYVAVYDEEGKVFYDWVYYNDAVNTARTKDKYLTFAEYIKTPDVKTTVRLTRVKEVLEDNLLGELVMDDSYLGKSIEGFTYPEGNTVKEDGELVVYADKTYLSKIIAMYAGDNKNYHSNGVKNPKFAVSDDEYKIDEDKLTVKGSAFITNKRYPTYGKVTITVYADGYRTQKIEAELLKADAKSEEPKNPEEPKKPENPEQGGNVPAGELKGLTMPTDSKKFSVRDMGDYFFIGSTFGVGSLDETEAWISSISAITVDGIKYNKTDKSAGVGENEFDIKLKSLIVDKPDNKGTEIPMVIEADGYKTYLFTLDNSDSTSVKVTKGEEVKKPENPAEPGNDEEVVKLEKDEGTGHWKLYVNPKEEGFMTTEKIMKIYVGEGNKTKSLSRYSDFTKNSDNIEFRNIIMFAQGDNKVSFAPEGYKKINCIINRTGNILTLKRQ